jgi:valyl-tRNA synthetase
MGTSLRISLLYKEHAWELLLISSSEKWSFAKTNKKGAKCRLAHNIGRTRRIIILIIPADRGQEQSKKRRRKRKNAMEPKIQSTSWNPEIEKTILKKWEHDDVYRFAIHDKSKPPFVIDTPPPYPSGRPWHIGAAAHYAQIDMIARTARMNGKNVLFPIGIDRNGLPVEIYTEKKYKVRMRQMDRQKFLDLCKVALDDLEAEMIQIMKSMGLSGNFNEYYRTDSDEYRALTQATFIELWKRGLVYLANRPNNYCVDCGTTIADAEIIYEEIPTKLVYMKFKIKEKKKTGDKDDDDTFIIIASTRPELLFACQAVIVNPDDDRYKHLHGLHAILPLFNREVSIIPHHSAKPEFGSGAVMVCSYGDQLQVSDMRGFE